MDIDKSPESFASIGQQRWKRETNLTKRKMGIMDIEK